MKCPNCDSKSGVDVHGRKFCHACKKDFDNSRSIFEEFEKFDASRKLALPVRDCEGITASEAAYLLQYGLSNDAIKQHGIFHSIKHNRLCFPYYVIQSQLQNTKKMVGCWMRSLDKQPKWLYTGEDKNSYIWRYSIDTNLPPSLCLVEDVISAIRVSNLMDCVCLGGTYLSKDSPLHSMLKQYDRVVLFLDGDKAGKDAAQRIRNQIKISTNVLIIRSRKDPKEFTDDQLGHLLYDC